MWTCFTKRPTFWINKVRIFKSGLIIALLSPDLSRSVTSHPFPKLPQAPPLFVVSLWLKASSGCRERLSCLSLFHFFCVWFPFHSFSNLDRRALQVCEVMCLVKMRLFTRHMNTNHLPHQVQCSTDYYDWSICLRMYFSYNFSHFTPFIYTHISVLFSPYVG